LNQVKFIFVYGTLRKEGALPIIELLDGRVHYSGKATIKGKIYLVDFYPGLKIVNDENPEVHGELYQLHNFDHDISLLDDYEGVSSPPNHKDLFRKITVIATTETGTKLKCLAYGYNRKITPAMKEIVTGDYIQSI
jgi:gamma-glutamylcyclotransferase (GGCT)/AIG2-like uncharacterized protein YtfP